MSSWKFTDQYASDYPALKASVLSVLTFSEHALNDTAFTGTLDLEASNPALAVLEKLIKIPKVPLKGAVTEKDKTLTIKLAPVDDTAITKGIASQIPLIGGQVTQSATISLEVKVSSEKGLSTNTFDLSITIGIDSRQATLVTQVPMSPGAFMIRGSFEHFGVGLSDLDFLMGDLAEGNKWFPSTELGPFDEGSPALELLNLGLVLYVQTKPDWSVQVISLSTSIGLTQIPLIDKRLYLNPLGITATISDPEGKAALNWGFMGSLVLCDYEHPGDLDKANFSFNFTLGISDFSISAQYDNPDDQPLSKLISDLLGQNTELGLPEELTITKFEFEAQANKTDGKIASFSAAVGMSGGFGLLEDFDLDSASISVDYNE